MSETGLAVHDHQRTEVGDRRQVRICCVSSCFGLVVPGRDAGPLPGELSRARVELGHHELAMSHDLGAGEPAADRAVGDFHELVTGRGEVVLAA